MRHRLLRALYRVYGMPAIIGILVFLSIFAVEPFPDYSQYAKADDAPQVDVAIGSAQPSVQFNKWGNECFIYLAPTTPASYSKSVIGDATRFDNAAISYEFSPTSPQVNFNDAGGYDIKITLKSKPVSNKITFSYNSKNTIAYFQPPLYDEEELGGEGNITTITETDAYDSELHSIIHRPEHVVNSIAFYRTGADNFYTSKSEADNYKSGKIGHLYRMKAIDALGDWEWFNWQLSGNKIIGSIRQDWLDKAIYPVTITPIGDTFGYTSAGGSDIEYKNGWSPRGSVADTYVASTGDTITSYSAYISTGGDSERPSHWSAYSVSGGEPDVRVSPSYNDATITPAESTSGKWFTSNAVSHTLTNGVEYGICSEYKAYSWSTYYHYDSGSSGDAQRHDTDENLPANWSTDNDYSYRFSWYATYTPGAGAPSAPTVTTSAAVAITTVTANVSGEITATGGENCDERGILYDTDGTPYADNWTDSGSFGTGVFSTVITNLTKGTKYHFKAFAHNSGGYGYGSEATFITLPDSGNGVTITATGNTTMDVSWNGSVGADLYTIRYASGASPPSDNASDTFWAQIAGTSTTITGLTPGEQYTVAVFPIAEDDGSYSCGTEDHDTDYTLPGDPNTFHTSNPTINSLDLDWAKGTGSDNTTIIRKEGSYPANRADGAGVYDNTGVSTTDSGLGASTTYFYRAWAYDAASGYWSAGYASANGTTSSISAPTVTTENATSVEETSATFSGNITSIGGSNATVWGFQYGVSTGNYSDNISNSGSRGVGNFTDNATGLTPGDAIYWRAFATNPAGTGFGAENVTITKPLEPPSANATPAGDSQLQLNWTAGTGSEYTEIRRDTGSYPTTNTSGTQVYFGALETYTDTSVNNSIQYFYSFFGIAYEGGLWACSDNYATANATPTSNITCPSVTTNAATLVEETTATLNGNLASSGGENCTVTFYYDTDLAAPFSSNETVGIQGTGAFSKGLTGLNKGDKYAFHASANNSICTDNGSTLTFMTKPDPATGFSVSSYGDTWIDLSWVNGDGMYQVTIRYSDSGYPSDNTSGSLGYSGNGASANLTGLDPNTEYYIKIFTHGMDDNTWSTADGAVTVSQLTTVGAPAVTMGAASNITNDSTRLNATITDDGGSSCNGTWYWGTTDQGETEGWDNNASQPGLSSGSIYYDISGTLAPGALYYGKIKIINDAATDWGSTVNWSTTNVTTIYPPTTLTLTDMGAISVKASWVPGLNSVYVMIRMHRDHYPASITDGELYAYSSGTTANVSGFDLEANNYKISAWGFAADNTTHSAAYTTASIGGENMEGVTSALEGIIAALSNFNGIVSQYFEGLLLVSVIFLAFWRKPVAADRDFLFNIFAGVAVILISLSWIDSYQGISIGLAILGAIIIASAFLAVIKGGGSSLGWSQIRGWFKKRGEE